MSTSHTDKKITIVSLPRSGHHMLVDILKVLDDNFTYCEFYSHFPKPDHSRTHPHSQSMCSSGDACKGPYDNSTSTIQFIKSHDFALDPNCDNPLWTDELLLDDQSKYIVIMRRDKVAQFESYYRFAKNDCPYLTNFREFVEYNLQYFTSFWKKWEIAAEEKDNILRLYYEDIIADPIYQVYRVLQFSYPHKQFDEKKVRDVVTAYGVEYKHKMTDQVAQEAANIIQEVVGNYSAAAIANREESRL